MTATSEVSEKEKRVLERVSDILEQTGEGMSLTEFQVVIKIISIVIVSSRITIQDKRNTEIQEVQTMTLGE